MISFSLAKKNIYTIIPVVISGTLVVVINLFFMEEYGFVISGISQVTSGLVLAAILFILGKRITELSINLSRSALLILIMFAYIGLVYFDMDSILKGNFVLLIVGGVICTGILSAVYMITYKKSKLLVD